MKFLTIQFSSFVIPFKDISYLLCYYIYRSKDYDIEQCQTPTNFLVAVLITLYPAFVGFQEVFNEINYL